jgi:competence protein ComEC
MSPSATAATPTQTAEQYQPLVLALTAAVAGMIVDRYAAWSAQHPWGAAQLATAALACWSLTYLLRWHRGGTLFLCLAIAGTAAAWHADRWRWFGNDDLGLAARDDTGPVVVEGIALTSPRLVPAPPFTALRSIPKGDVSELLLRVTAARHGATWKPASGVAAVDVEGHVLGVRAGDRVRVFALLTKPSAPLNPGEFAFDQHQRSRRILARLRSLFPEHVERLEYGGWWNWRRGLATLRDQGNWQLHRHVGSSRGSLAAAILLGAREQLHPEQNEGFLVTGTIHILSISGVHVGILAYGFFLIARSGLFRGRSALLATMLFTAGYALLTDAQPPVVRAAVLIVLMCAARWQGRAALGFNSLAAAGLIVLAWDPCSLFFAGTQLSFLAVAVMIYFREWIQPIASHDPLDRLIARARPWYVRWLRAAAAETYRVCLTGTLIWAVSLPLVWQQYNLLSPVGLALNPIVWLPVTLALFTGFGVVALGWLSPAAANLCGWLCDQSLWAIEWSIDVGQRFPGSYAWLPSPPWWWIALFYVALALHATFPLRAIAWRHIGALVCVWAAVAAWLSGHSFARWTTPGERPLVCTFVSVGHGTACVLELPNGRTLLYDAGRLGSPMAAIRPVSCTLWSRGITHLDGILVSHADADHYNAIPELTQRFSVGMVGVGPTMFERPIAALAEFQKGVAAAGVPLRVLQAGDRLRLDDDVRIEVLHPPRKGVIGSDNANSIVLLIEYAGKRLLLPGDLESPGLDDLLAETPLDCDIVMAPHHGSGRSNPFGFTAWCRPEHIVISGARDPDNPDEAWRVRRALASTGGTVYHTAETGAVRFVIDRGAIRVKTVRPLP